MGGVPAAARRVLAREVHVQPLDLHVAAAERASLGLVESYRVLALVDDSGGDDDVDASRTQTVRVAAVGSGT